jgi:hypothetical protein
VGRALAGEDTVINTQPSMPFSMLLDSSSNESFQPFNSNLESDSSDWMYRTLSQDEDPDMHTPDIDTLCMVRVMKKYVAVMGL